MFSEFVTFKKLSLYLDHTPVPFSWGLEAIDISHDNETYNVFVTPINETLDTISFLEFINQHFQKGDNISLKVTYELKKSQNEITDTYQLIPENNAAVLNQAEENVEAIVLNGFLKARNNVEFNHNYRQVAGF